MKAFVVLWLFAVTCRRSTNAVEHREQPFQPGTDEIVGALSKCSKLDGFDDRLNATIDDGLTSVVTPAEKTLEKALAGVKEKVEMLDEAMMEGVSEYFQKLMVSYLIEAHAFVTDRSNSDVNRDVAIGDHPFCVVSFLTGYGYNDSVVIHTVSFLQTIRFERIAPVDLKRMLLKFVNNLKTESTNAEHLDTSGVRSLTTGTAELLNIYKEEVKTFSNAFCLSTVQPLVDKDLFEPQPHADRDQFIDYIFQEEYCSIYVDEHSDKIVDWDCSIALTSTLLLNIKCEKKATNYEFKNVKSVKKTLSSIKNDLSQSKLDSQQIMIYYNIAADLMVFIAIKEGKKIMRYIKRRISSICLLKSSITFDELHMMRAALFLFMLSLEKLINNVFEKLYIRVIEDSCTNNFNFQLNFLLQLFDVPRNENLKDYFDRERCKSFQNIFLDTENAYGRPERLEFIEYYLLSPLQHVNTLYNFNYSYFK